MKLSGKIALVATGALFFFAFFFSGWMIFRYQEMMIQQAKTYEAQDLKERTNRFMREVKRWDGEGKTETERQLFRSCFAGGNSPGGLYADGQEIYNMTGYTLNQVDFDRKEEAVLLDTAGWAFIQELREKKLLVCVREEKGAQGRIYQIFRCKDIREIYRGTKQLFCQGMAAALAFALLLVAAMQLIFRRLWRPVYRLRETANQIADGQYGMRAEYGRKDEIRPVADSFNRMAEKVEQHICELSQVNERQRQLLGSLAHELKTPMTAIQGYAETLQRVKLTPEREGKALSYIESECKRLSRLSVKMLELTGLYQADGKLEKRELKAGELFEKAEVMARYRLSQKKIRLKKEINPENLLIFGDEDLLISFLLNLIDNGCKASEEGKILILRAEERRIGVQDFGRGIPEEELERITEPFYMVDKSRARREGGAGLGLALCRQIAEVHGGQLKIRSREGAGTFVWLEWPGTVTTSLQTGEDLLTEKGV